MKQNILSLVLCIVTLIGSSVHGIIYLDDIDNWDVDDSQNIILEGDMSQAPASEPIVLMDEANTDTDDGSPDPTIDLDALIEEESSEPTSTSNNQTKTTDDTTDVEEQTTPTIDLDALASLGGLDKDAEFLMSLQWLYSQGLTKYNTTENYRPDYYLTRVDAAKMLSILSEKTFNRTQRNNESCDYDDVTGYDDTTKQQVKDACELGIFRSATLFNPDVGITKGQLVVVLIRMYDGKLYDETSEPWYANYVDRGYQIGLLTSRSYAGMDDVITRGDVAKLLYKLRNIYLNQSPTTKSDLPFIYKIDDFDDNTITAMIDVDVLRDDSINVIEMELNEDTYYFAKSQVYNYGSKLNNFQVYGYIYESSSSIEPQGVATRRVQQGVIQEAIITMRDDKYRDYSIRPMSDGIIYRVNVY